MASHVKSAITLKEIDSMRAWARAQMHTGERLVENMREVLQDLDAAERVISLNEEVRHKEVECLNKLSFSPRNPMNPGTVGAFVWEAMDSSRELWLTTDEVWRLASRLRGEAPFPLNTLRVTLSELRRFHILAREGQQVALISRLNEKGIPYTPWEPPQRKLGRERDPRVFDRLLMEALDEAI